MKSIIDYVALGPGFPSWNNLTSVPFVEPSHKFSGLTIQNTLDRFCMEPLGRFARVASFPDARRHAQNYSRTSGIRRCLDFGRHSLSPDIFGPRDRRINVPGSPHRQCSASRFSCAYKYRGRTIRYAKGRKNTQKGHARY